MIYRQIHHLRKLAILAILGWALCLVAPAWAHNGVISVCDPPYSAVAGDQIDDTVAFQSALDAARGQMQSVYVPAGSYWFTGHLTVPSGVSLVGSCEGAPGQSLGTILNATESAGNADGAPFIALEGNAEIKGVIIAYPLQSPSVAPPAPYPWSIQGLGTDCKVENVTLLRSYKGIDFGTHPCSRHYINNVHGSPLLKGIYIDGSIDVGRINNVHFRPTEVTPGSALESWIQQNGEAITIAKADWEWITNTYIRGYKTGFRFIAGTGGNNKAAGPPNYVQIAHCGANITLSPIIVEICNVLDVSQSVFKGYAIQILSSSTYPVRFSQCSFSPIQGTASLVDASGTGRVSFTDCTFEFWDTGGTLAPALRANCASICVQGCEFGTTNRPSFFVGSDQKVQIRLTSNVKSAIIMENRFRYGQRITNSAGANVVIADNVTDQLDGYAQ